MAAQAALETLYAGEPPPDLPALATDLPALRATLETRALGGSLGAAARATAWRLFLRTVDPGDPSSWAAAVAAQRQAYARRKRAALDALDNAMAAALPDDDDDDDDDAAAATLEDAADQIRRDCERCFPEGAGDYFLDPVRQKLLFDVLLTWAHGHAEPSYRQGTFARVFFSM